MNLPRPRWSMLGLALGLALSLSGCISISIDHELQAARRQLHADPIELSTSDDRHAHISAQGDLQIEGADITLSGEQRRALLVYRTEVVALGEQLMDQAMTLAQDGVRSVMLNALIGRAEQAAQRIEARAQALTHSPETCSRIRRINALKTELDRSLPALQPYEGLQASEWQQCSSAATVAAAH